MNYLIKLLMAMTLAIAGSHAQAIQIGPGDCGDGCSNGELTSIDELNGFLQSMLGLEELYTSSVGSDIDSGLFASSYATKFTNVPESPSDALIERIAGEQGSISCLECYLLVMDNDANPAAWYLFNLGAWSWDSISLTGFWPEPDDRAISYVSIYGKGTSVVQSAAVPAPGPLVLLTIGLAGLGMRRLKRSS